MGENSTNLGQIIRIDDEPVGDSRNVVRGRIDAPNLSNFDARTP
jgi:hypothetical protein